jgi:hypothetical protein
MRRGEEKFVSEIRAYPRVADEIAEFGLKPRRELLRLRGASFSAEELAPFFQKKCCSGFGFQAGRLCCDLALIVAGAGNDFHAHLHAAANEIESRGKRVVASSDETLELRLRDEDAEAKRQRRCLVEQVSCDRGVREDVWAIGRHTLAAELANQHTEVSCLEQTDFGAGNAGEGARQCVDACKQAVNV